MTHIVKEKLAALLLEHPKPKGIVMGYGTAGFRARAEDTSMDHDSNWSFGCSSIESETR